MKFFLQFLIAFSSLSMILALTKDEAELVVKSLTEKCKKSEGATDADVDSIVKEQVAESPSSKCMLACLLGTFSY